MWVPCSPNSGNFSAKRSVFFTKVAFLALWEPKDSSEFTPSSHQLFLLFWGLFPSSSSCLEVFRTSSPSSLLSVCPSSAAVVAQLGKAFQVAFHFAHQGLRHCCSLVSALTSRIPIAFSWCTCHCLELIKHPKHFHPQILSRDYIGTVAVPGLNPPRA